MEINTKIENSFTEKLRRETHKAESEDTLIKQKTKDPYGISWQAELRTEMKTKGSNKSNQKIKFYNGALEIPCFRNSGSSKNSGFNADFIREHMAGQLKFEPKRT